MGEIIVTGAAGFIGSNIVATLNEDGVDDIVVVDWLGDAGQWRNLGQRMFTDHCVPEDLMARLHRKTPDAIIHMGAISSTSVSDGDAVMRLNFRYTLDLIDWCTTAGVPLIYASSAATYGDGVAGYDDMLDFEGLRGLRPLNLYGWSKHQIDLILARRVALQLPLPPRCVGLKFFNVYGPNEHHKGSMMSVVGKKFADARDGKPIELFRSHHPDYVDGGQMRDFVYVKDAARVTTWLLDDGPTHGVINVGTGKATSFLDFVEALYAGLGQEPDIRYIDMPDNIRNQYQYFTEAKLDRLRRAGYTRPFMNVADGVGDYVGYLTAPSPYR